MSETPTTPGQLPNCDDCGQPQTEPGELVFRSVTLVIGAPNENGAVTITGFGLKLHRHKEGKCPINQ